MLFQGLHYNSAANSTGGSHVQVFSASGRYCTDYGYPGLQPAISTRHQRRDHGFSTDSRGANGSSCSDSSSQALYSHFYADPLAATDHSSHPAASPNEHTSM